MCTAIELRLKGPGRCNLFTVHSGLTRTQITHSMGLDKYWGAGGAVMPDIAAKRLGKRVRQPDIGKSGQH